MKSHASFAKTLLACAAACVLAACGSDDDKQDDLPSPDAVSKYVGTWDTGCVNFVGIGSLRTVWRLSPQGGSGDLLRQQHTDNFSGQNCTNNIGSEEKVAIMTFHGTKTLRSGQVADVFISEYTNPEDPYAWWDVLYKKDNKLWLCSVIKNGNDMAECNKEKEFLPLHPTNPQGA